MKFYLRKIILTVFVTALVAVSLAVFCSAETASGTLIQLYKGKVIINNNWTFDTVTGLLTINANTTGYNETGRTMDISLGSWGKYKTQIKNVVLNGTFHKVSNNAFNGCTNLESVMLTSDIGQIDRMAFYACVNLTSVYLDKHYAEPNTADFRNVTTIHEDAIDGTSLTKLWLSSAIKTVNEEIVPLQVHTLIGETGSAAETYANQNGIIFITRAKYVMVNLYDGNTLFGTQSVEYGEILKMPVSNGASCVLFEDEDCTKLYNNEKFIISDLTLYKKVLLKFSGFCVRIADYAGLRAMFEFYNPGTEAGNGTVVLNVGALACKTEYALSDSLTLDTPGAQNIPIYSDGERVGMLLSNPVDEIEMFAATAVGFENESGKPDGDRCTDNIVFRGYITILNTETNVKRTYYTDAVGGTLDQISRKFLQSSKLSEYTSKEAAFVKTAADASDGHRNNLNYTKNELLTLLNTVYNDNNKIIVGQEVDVSENPQIVLNYYKANTGEYPSILGMDLACYGMRLPTMTEDVRNENIRQLVDYCRQGGIITASSHFANPTGNWGTNAYCRGLLGGNEYWRELLTEGSELNSVFKAELNTDAEFMRLLGNNGVQVLWRPLHEMNGSWFWWCIKQGSVTIDVKYMRELWVYIYDYYTNTLGLDNLLWVYSPNVSNGTSPAKVTYCYPGDEYVDMVGCDWYTSGNYEVAGSGKSYENLMDYGMPTALTEFGVSGTYNPTSIDIYNNIIRRMLNDGMKLTYVLTWTANHRFPARGDSDKFMAFDCILSRDDVKALFTTIK